MNIEASPEFDPEQFRASLEALGKLLKQDPQDRFLAIVEIVDLEDVITRLIKLALVDDKKQVDELLESESYLGTFSAKIQLAYCLGLISRDEYHDLNILRKIRNEFAHKPRALTFNHPQVADRCKSLKLLYRRNLPDLNPREMFLTELYLLMQCFEERFRQAGRQRSVPAEFDLPEIDSDFIDRLGRNYQ